MKRWNGIVEFISVAETLSFSKSAEQLGISQSEVSKRVSELERRLNTQLLRRSTRVLQLTNEGQIYYQTYKKLLLNFENAEDQIQWQSRQALQGQIRLCFVGGSRPAFQVAIIAEFLKHHPDIQLEAIFADQLPDLLRENIDLALVVGEVDQEAFSAIQVAWVQYQLAASPDFVARYGQPTHPRELEQLPCVIHDRDRWHLANKEETIAVNLHGQWHSHNMGSCIHACLSGLGVFTVPAHAMKSLVTKNKLVHLLPDWHMNQAVSFIIPQSDYVPTRVMLFRDFLINMMAPGTQPSSIAIGLKTEQQAILEQIENSLHKQEITALITSKN